MAYKVLIPQDVMEEGKAFLREKGYKIKMGSGITVDEIKSDVVDCDAILARTAPFPEEVIEAGEKLRVIARHGVGVDNIAVKRAEELGIWVTNARESNSNTVAEYATGMIVALGRNFVRGDRAVRSGDWELRNRVRGVDIDGKTLGVLGMGKIGRLVTMKAALGLSMKVIGYDPFLAPGDFPEEVEKVDEWDDIFERSDFISVHIPSSPETKKAIGKAEFDRMKNGAFLINAARGDVVDEEALAAALEAGDIAGAGLDVYEQEPPAADCRLYGLENVILTPHNAALTIECMRRMAMHAAQGIHEVLTGKKPTWPVNSPKK